MALTVRELINELEQYGDDMKVQFAYNYGDHWRTTVAAEVNSVDTGHVKHSEYHRMDKVVDLNDEDGDDVGDLKEVVILS